MITPEDEARIAAYAREVAAAMPDFTPAQLARLRRLIQPLPRPTSGRGK